MVEVTTFEISRLITVVEVPFKYNPGILSLALRYNKSLDFKTKRRLYVYQIYVQCW